MCLVIQEGIEYFQLENCNLNYFINISTHWTQVLSAHVLFVEAAKVLSIDS